ncbi:hypothetical protein F0919_08115 [Taibaiella lutea]|uniref:Uncharacterized protein n=1 Tax=Taibaiella lutea TaxID=2608001 RepID=A0A5M6CHU7_9BACT|nr:hypothetical protein [Taibaiella lutea]KAA5534576.1 hypothetical protein F0919_08115 [Taibaiella lutea]
MEKDISKHLKDFLEQKEQFDDLPLFYRKLEVYTDDMGTAMGVEKLNMAPSGFYQTSKISIGFFFKKAAHIAWEEDKLKFRQL